MPSSTTLSAEARGLTKAAKAVEESGNNEQAKALYLQAACLIISGNCLGSH